jgi:hypothetical protein
MSEVIEQLAAELSADAPVDVATMFRRPAVRSAGKIVAFLGKEDELILKLPRPRAVQLIDDGIVEPVVLGERVLREWVTISIASHPQLWVELAREALAYVRSLAD